jgi:hypothetical protein
MNANHKGYSAGWKPFLGVLLAVCFLATAAHADSLFTGTFTLTHPVRWDKAVLAPGNYSLVLDRSNHTFIIRDAETGKGVARILAQADNSLDSRDGSELLITVRGEQRAVYAVRLAGLGKVYQKAHPFAGSERAVEEARNTEAIPVEMARK